MTLTGMGIFNPTTGDIVTDYSGVFRLQNGKLCLPINSTGTLIGHGLGALEESAGAIAAEKTGKSLGYLGRALDVASRYCDDRKLTGQDVTGAAASSVGAYAGSTAARAILAGSGFALSVEVLVVFGAGVLIAQTFDVVSSGVYKGIVGQSETDRLRTELEFMREQRQEQIQQDIDLAQDGFSWDPPGSIVVPELSDTNHAPTIPGQATTIQTPSGPKIVPVMTTVMTPSGAQQVWQGSQGVTAPQSSADRAADQAAAGRGVASLGGGVNGSGGEGFVNNGHGPVGGSGTGSASLPTGSGGTTQTYTSGTGYVGDHPAPGKPYVEPMVGPRPVLLDLNGNGIQITDLSKSTTFIDAGGDGKLHHTAWAAAGDGVLFIDADGDGVISDKREYVFTEWALGAQDDMEALRKAFGSNGDGKLTVADVIAGRAMAGQAIVGRGRML